MEDEQVEGVLLNSQTRAVTVSFAIAAVLGLLFAAFNVDHAGRVVAGVIFCWVMVVAAVQTATSSIKWDERRSAAGSRVWGVRAVVAALD